MSHRIVTAVAALFVAATSAHAQSGTITVSPFWDIYKSGGNGPGSPEASAVAPTVINLTSGSGRTLSFSAVTGTWSCVGGAGYSADGLDAGGNICVGAANVSSSGVISSYVTPGRSTTLVGLFLGAGLPGSAPAARDYSAAGAYTQASYTGILLGQVFFIGDGRTTNALGGGAQSGVVQTFAVPDAATRLYLGFADACGFSGSPDCYGDNSGSLSASYSVTAVPTSAVPEPATIALVGGGLLALAGAARRRRA